MSMFESGHGSAISSLLEHYPWGAIGEGTVVDIGGSHGSRGIAIATRFPSLRCIVLDLPEVVAGGPSNVHPNLQSRVTFAAHDFFTKPPEIANGADVYLFCRVFHNWSDKYSIKILKSLVPALKYGSRILISDICLPEPNTLPIIMEKKMRLVSYPLQALATTFGRDILIIYHRQSDLGMMAMLNAKERGRDDWAELFREADERYRFLGIHDPPSSQMSLIEASWEGYNAI